MAKKKKQTAFDKLSDKHKLFVKNYVANFAVGYKAYLAVRPTAKYSTARVEASKLLTKPNIKQAIEEEYAIVYAGIQTELEKSKTYKMIHAIGDSDISDIIDLKEGTLTVKDFDEIPPEARQSIQSIVMDEKDMDNGHSKNIKVTLHPKIQALKMRAEIQRLLDPKAEVKQVEIVILPAERPEIPDKNNEN